MPDEQAVPQVTLLTQDGTEVECDVTRHPELDRPEGHDKGQVTYFRAVPRKRVKLGTYEVRHTTPAHTAFFVDVPRQDLMDSIRPEEA